MSDQTVGIRVILELKLPFMDEIPEITVLELFEHEEQALQAAAEIVKTARLAAARARGVKNR